VLTLLGSFKARNSTFPYKEKGYLAKLHLLLERHVLMMTWFMYYTIVGIVPFWLAFESRSFRQRKGRDGSCRAVVFA
jgi:hypothetical protein